MARSRGKPAIKDQTRMSDIGQYATAYTLIQKPNQRNASGIRTYQKQTSADGSRRGALPLSKAEEWAAALLPSTSQKSAEVVALMNLQIRPVREDASEEDLLDEGVEDQTEFRKWPQPQRRNQRRTICGSPDKSFDMDDFKPNSKPTGICAILEDGSVGDAHSDTGSIASDQGSDDEWKPSGSKRRGNTAKKEASNLDESMSARFTSLSLKGTKKSVPRTLKALLSSASLEDRRFLYEGMTEGAENFQFGFGQGQIIAIPQSWELSYRVRVTNWLTKLGFEMITTSKYRIGTALANQIVHELKGMNVRLRRKDLPHTTDGDHQSSHKEMPKSCTPRKCDKASRQTPLKDLTNKSGDGEDDWLNISPGKTSSEADESADSFGSLDLGSPIAKLQSPGLSPKWEGVPRDSLSRPSVAGRASSRGDRGPSMFALSPLREDSECDSFPDIEAEERRETLQILPENRMARIQRNRNRRISSMICPPRASSTLPRRLTEHRATPKVSECELTVDVWQKVLEYSSDEDLRLTMVKVSPLWRKASLRALAWHETYGLRTKSYATWKAFLEAFPVGEYLSDGAFKEVFKVWAANPKRCEAVSVMDIDQIAETGNELMIRQEVFVSLLLSKLSLAGICSNFLTVFETFEFPHSPPKRLRWGSSENKRPCGSIGTQGPSKTLSKAPKATAKGNYQYIRMELCDGGDCEDFIRAQESAILPVDIALAFLFQMGFSLFVGRTEANLRHFDVKLLNFLLKRIDTTEKSTCLTYGIGQKWISFQLSSQFAYYVKLADYGTADISDKTLDKPATSKQFTTFENTPIELLLYGSKAAQGFACDTFAFGLCMLHIFTGCAPYEEIMEEVVCPATLKLELESLWETLDEFAIIREVIDSEDDWVILANTLYRFLVLLGFPSENGETTMSLGSCPLLAKAEKVLLRGRGNAVLRYKEDRSTFSLASGSNKYVRRARERLESIPDGAGINMIRQLLSFDPSRRPTMLSFLTSPLFKSFFVDDPSQNIGREKGQVFKAYFSRAADL